MTSSCRGEGNLAGVWLTAPSPPTPPSLFLSSASSCQTAAAAALLLLQMGQVCVCVVDRELLTWLHPRTKFWLEWWTQTSSSSHYSCDWVIPSIINQRETDFNKKLRECIVFFYIPCDWVNPSIIMQYCSHRPTSNTHPSAAAQHRQKQIVGIVGLELIWFGSCYGSQWRLFPFPTSQHHPTQRLTGRPFSPQNRNNN